MSDKSIKEKVDEIMEKTILKEKLEDLVSDRFASYSKYIIQERALPDVRDGLKPVQRRILYAMHAMGMHSDKPFKKSARIVGEVIGKYHPHGDSSVYDAMVRMTQAWKTNMLLVDMHGNNGSIDNDPAAAMRYTEARLSKYAENLLEDIDKKTVNFIPNFDDEEYEPVVLPAKFPNLLVNGAMGMATGYATNIPPHNLNEVIDAVIHMIDYPDVDVNDLMHFIQGPDFPTGAIVEGTSGIRKAFKTGKGKVKIRSKVEVKEKKLIVHEIPYEVNKSDLVRKIDLIRDKKKIDGITEVRDESDRDGLRIVIELKKEISSDVVLAYLNKYTDLSVNYNYNMVAIDHKSPKQLSLVEIMRSYIQHQKEVIRNRSNFELYKAEKRKHIVLGFLKMVDVLDEVIALIRKSKGKADAITRLTEAFGFSNKQADAIVSLQLYRLSTTDVTEMKKEHARLQREIKALKRILNNEDALEEVIKDELRSLAESFLAPRKTVIKKEIKKVEIDEGELIQNENVMVMLTVDGYIKRSSLKSYSMTTSETGIKNEDHVLKQALVNTRDTMLVFTTFGNYIHLPVYKIKETKWRDVGEYIGNHAHLKDNESIIDFLIIPNFDVDKHVLLATEQAQIKQVELRQFQTVRLGKTYNCMGASAINKLVSVDLKENFDTGVAVVSKNGYVVRYDISEIPTQGLGAKGVKGMNLRDDVLIGAKYISPVINKDEILMLTNRGALKREYTRDIEESHRPAKGKRYLKRVKTNPYAFIDIAATNVFRLKDRITIRILNDNDDLVIDGPDLKHDRYEHGIPLLEKKTTPLRVMIDIEKPEEAHDMLYKLYEDTLAGIEDDEDEEEDEVLHELEKIISSTDNDDDEEEKDPDDDDQVIQETLF